MTKARKPPARRRPSRNRPIGENLKIAARAAALLERRKAGDSYRMLAAQFGVTVKTAYTIVQTELGALDGAIKQTTERVRELELERCDVLLRALEKGIAEGDPRAILAAVRVAERRAKMLGLDGPLLLAGTGPDGEPTMIRIVHEHYPGPTDVTGAGRDRAKS